MRFISYLRVSTQRQGRSGLGLQAQQQMIDEYVKSTGGTVVASYTEIESGARNDRPELSKALSSCRVYGATLLVGKLDRLSRDSYFVEKLLHEGARFRATDCPEANETMIRMLSIFASYEREQIAARTKAALAAAKRKGVVLGGDRGNILDVQRKGSRAGNAVRSAAAQQRARDLAPIIAEIRASGAETLAQVSQELNQRGITTARGSQWTPCAVARVSALV
jgi:DNA invertase Pin-like site-specific DNA recombinase